MSKLGRQIANARPRLRVVSPLAYFIILIYGIFNILLGLSFVFAIDQAKFSAPLLIVNHVFNYNFWAIIFISIGIFKLFSLYINNWSLSRRSLIVGVSIKVAWALALIIRTIVSPGTFFLTLLWVALATVQIVTYIFFMPPAVGSYKQLTRRRNDK